jgi:hypothetical protein
MMNDGMIRQGYELESERGIQIWSEMGILVRRSVDQILVMTVVNISATKLAWLFLSFDIESQNELFVHEFNIRSAPAMI